MRLPGRALVALAALAVLMGVAADAIILTGHMSDRPTWAVLDTALGASFVGTGLYAWWRRPHNRSGALMTWVGFLWFVTPLEFSDNTVIFTVGEFTDPLPIAALAHLVLAVPNGRLESGYHRALVAFGYVNATLLQLPGFLFDDTAASCDGCPANPLLIARHPDVADIGAGLVNVFAVVTIALITRELIRR